MLLCENYDITKTIHTNENSIHSFLGARKVSKENVSLFFCLDTKVPKNQDSAEG